MPLAAAVAAFVALGAIGTPALAQEGAANPLLARNGSVNLRVAPYEIRRILHEAGYRDVVGVRYYKVGYPDNYYRAYAWRDGQRYDVRVSEQTARIVESNPIGAARPPERGSAVPVRRPLDGHAVHEILLNQGYTQVSDVRFIADDVNAHYVVAAWRDGRHYVIKVDDDDGAILSRTRIE